MVRGLQLVQARRRVRAQSHLLGRRHWWGAGPGAHSHLGNERFFNVKHPSRYIDALGRGELPIKETETLTEADRHMEKIMLGLRLREGIPEAWLDAHAAPALERFIGRGLLERAGDRVRITKPGRLLADGIITDVLVAEET